MRWWRTWAYRFWHRCLDERVKKERSMSTRPDLLEHALAGDIFETEATQPQTSSGRESIAWNPDRFGEEQLRSLVRQGFLLDGHWPGKSSSLPSRMAMLPESVCGSRKCWRPRFLEMWRWSRPTSSLRKKRRLWNSGAGFCPAGFRPLRDTAQRVSSHLWRVPAKCSWVKTKPASRWNGYPED